MKLTKEQIAKIEETLVLNGLVYDDIKLELIDHIALALEQKRESKIKIYITI
jgi:hypothetical protein